MINPTRSASFRGSAIRFQDEFTARDSIGRSTYLQNLWRQSTSRCPATQLSLITVQDDPELNYYLRPAAPAVPDEAPPYLSSTPSDTP